MAKSYDDDGVKMEERPTGLSSNSPSLFISSARLEAALEQVERELMAARTPAGYWTGELSSSALSTATAVIALAVVARETPGGSNGEKGTGDAERKTDLLAVARAGLKWLAEQANADGGWGDTTRSLSNISTTALCWAAFGAVPGADAQYRATVLHAEKWLADYIHIPHAALCTPHSALIRAIIQRYGKDRTFSVPILTACALAGRFGSGPEAWRWVLPLPFELAACPHQCFAILRLPVVSYALPALIAMGQARHVHRPSRNPLVRLVRHLTRQRTLRVLTSIQPGSGGFLEATPLTSFVVMSLAGSGQALHPVTRRGIAFLRQSQRPDGSWAIDTNLATWVTTLAVNALAQGAEASGSQGAHDARQRAMVRWLLDQQYRAEHPYTHAAPGGWAWTDLPGGVPDADDTAGAVLALFQARNAECRVQNGKAEGVRESEFLAAASAGIHWLLELQNRDGGIPTFCRGWGALPFDRSSADLTAHALRAWLAWLEELAPALQQRVNQAFARGLRFLEATQRADGAWVPLWFGNQFAPEDENPTYGTARVVLALAEARERFPAAGKLLSRGAG
ncbi:MAG TPA: prenyltransferase/squalene oxidase repeat-containing protein, partial [Bacillota bacterium]|nr:prenyltransferase/squalene oxidase repeat-containing protein [Bacillota bacterium]